MFQAVRELTGRRLPRRIPAPVAAVIGLLEECRAAITGRPPLLTVGTVEILQRDWPLDSQLAHRELAYAIVPLREGVARLLAEIDATGGVQRGDRAS